MDIGIKEIHIGKEINRRREELGLSKTEFGARIGIRQQHVNRILERETIETKKLIEISRVLDYNFFSLYCETSPTITAYLGAVNMGTGGCSNNIGESVGLAMELQIAQVKIEGLEKSERQLTDQVKDLKEYIADLKSR